VSFVQRSIQHDLTRRVREMTRAPDDMTDPHGDVVDDDAEVVGRQAVGLENHEITKFLCLEHDLAADDISHDDRLFGDDETDRRLQPQLAQFLVLLGGQASALAVVDGPPPAG